MPDFQNALFNLSLMPPAVVHEAVSSFLSPKEKVLFAYSNTKGYVVFTDVHMIVSSSLGVTGLRRSVTTIAYRHLSAFTLQYVGTFDLATKMILIFDGKIDTVELGFARGIQTDALSQFLASCTM